MVLLVLHRRLPRSTSASALRNRQPTMTRLPTELRQRQIADSALTLLASDGSRGFTTAAVARAVGVSEATLFRHFTNMDAILDAAVTALEQLLFPADLDDGSEDALVALHAFLQRRAALLRKRPGVMRILFSDEIGRTGSPETARRVAALRRRSRAIVRGCLERAAAQGTVRQDLTVAELVSVAHGMILSLVFNIDGPASGGFESAWTTFLRLVQSGGVDS